MSTVTLRPNGIVTDSDLWVNTGGAASKNAALADDLDATYILCVTDGTEIVFDMTTAALGGATINSVRLRMRDSMDAGDTFTDAISLYTRLGSTDGAQDIDQDATNSIHNYSGAVRVTKPGGGGWAQADIDALRVRVLFQTGDFTPNGKVMELYADVDYTPAASARHSRPDTLLLLGQ